MSQITLKEVKKSDEDIEALFYLIKQRGSHAISHKSVPAFSDHAKFVKNHPYRHWFIVLNDAAPIGSIYIGTENCLGIFLLNWRLDVLEAVLEKITTTYNPLPPVPSVRTKGYFINVSPYNKELLSLIDQLELKLIQKSFAIPS